MSSPLSAFSDAGRLSVSLRTGPRSSASRTGAYSFASVLMAASDSRRVEGAAHDTRAPERRISRDDSTAAESFENLGCGPPAAEEGALHRARVFARGVLAGERHRAVHALERAPAAERGPVPRGVRASRERVVGPDLHHRGARRPQLGRELD